jgi:hypothetical protein
VRRDQLLEFFDHGAAALLGARLVHQHGERLDRLGVDQDLPLHQIGGPEVGEVIVDPSSFAELAQALGFRL